MTTTMSPIRAFVSGVAAVVKAPLVVVAAALVTLVVALPFALVVGAHVQESLASQPPVALEETEIDPEWWQEFRAHARGLDATFTPAIVGFAAPLDSISAVLDGRRPPPAVLGPIVLSIAAWAFLWGGALQRYREGRAIGVKAFTAAGLRFMPRFGAIALVAAVAIAILYFTLHALLFGPFYRFLAGRTSSEQLLFFARVILYIVFFAPVAAVGLVADYARVAMSSGTATTVAASLRASMKFIRHNIGAVATLYLIGAIIFVAVTVGYGVLELVGGSQVGGWRAIVLGQAFIVIRLVIRLSAGAAGLRMFAARSTP